MTDPIVVEDVVGAGIEAVRAPLAALRIAVFREYPYLYDGTPAYEAQYLATYAAAPQAVVVVARAGDRIIGASTGLPLWQHSDEVVPPLAAAGFDPDQVFYLGESVLDPAFRGRGLGHAFFDHREAHARACGYPIAAFCAVDRPADHPRRPAGYVSHDAFWTKRGYVRRPDITARFAWRDLDEADETGKTMTFWIRRL